MLANAVMYVSAAVVTIEVAGSSQSRLRSISSCIIERQMLTHILEAHFFGDGHFT